MTQPFTPSFSTDRPLQIGIVGTGYAANKRAEAFQEDQRAQLRAVAGSTLEKSEAFAQKYEMSAVHPWQELVSHPELDLIVICSINRDHGAIARSALENGKHVIIEYPLSLSATEAEELIALAQTQNKLLHVEHIELLGGVHQAIRQHLPEIGEVFYARYSTIVPQRPVPQRWTYHHEMFGFPLSAALSRVNRFTDLFGHVASVSCHTRFWDTEDNYYKACLCNAQLRFHNGLIAEITYGKGETFWQGSRTFELHGEQGSLILEGEQGTLIKGDEKHPIAIEPRRGLFVKDTQFVLDYLTTGTPLYVAPEASLYALQVADSARLSAETGKTVNL